MTKTGPLQGVRILEVGGIGPNPFAAMLLADMGADVIRVDRTTQSMAGPNDPTMRGRQAIAVDLKSEEGKAAVRALADQADALIEGFRPGVMERLGLGPEELQATNPKLVYGRMTGYGQDGPMAMVAGHDINYISLTGALGATQRAGEKPMFALNLVGDYGGGAMFLVVGVLAGIIEARTSGKGQVVDAAMVDGASLLTALVHGFVAGGMWTEEPGTNLLDSGAHFYETYATKDGGHVAVGPIEPQFYARLLELLELSPDEFPQFDRDRWPELKGRFAEVFAARDADEWAALLEHEETCATVVRSLHDAHAHPHLAARGTFVELDGVRQPGPAPRFSRTPSQARPREDDGAGALARWGLGEDAVAAVLGAAPAKRA